MKSILLIFGGELPRKNKKWFAQFDRVLGPKEVQELTDSGSVQEACQLVDNLSRIIMPDGRHLPKVIAYRGYELWWMNYDNLFESFCLPYTQYRRLLQYLKDFNKVHLYRAPHSALFRYFLKAYGRQCLILNESKKIFPSLGILVQVILSLPFLLWLRIIRPKLMVYTSDQFDPAHPPYDYDFRMRFIYEELRKRKIPFIEFIRSAESLPIVLQHAIARKRPVVYSAAMIIFLHYLARFFRNKEVDKLTKSYLSLKKEPEERFWFLIATCYLQNLTGIIWSVRAMKLTLRWIGVRSAIIITGASRTFHEILACKALGIKTVGIQHGITPRYYVVYEFMPGFDNKNTLSVDIYGLWSEWWKEYFIRHSRAYRPEQLFVSGHMRPLEEEVAQDDIYEFKNGPIKVLFVADQLAELSEIMPFFLAILGAEDFSVYIKFRVYRDIIENLLRENHPQLLEKVKILRGTMHEAIARTDIAVGCHSTGVLEALLQLKPFVFYRTPKWGDYLEIKFFDRQNHFFAENPGELLDKIRKSREISKEVLMELREKYFGDPHKNGSKWVIDQAVKFI